MSTPYNNSFNDTTSFTDECFQVNLAQNTSLSITAPGTSKNYYQVRFTYSSASNVFVSTLGAITMPGANASRTDKYTEYKPGCFDGSKRQILGGTAIYFMTPDAAGAYVGVVFELLPG